MLPLTGLFKTYAKRRTRILAAVDHADSQRRELRRILSRAARTKFGKAHDFATIDDVDGFQKSVPLRTYESFWQQWWSQDFPRLGNVSWPGLIPFFATTSGTTTGRIKYIPVTREMLRSYRRAGLDTLAHHVTAVPGSQVLDGRIMMLGGSTDLTREAPGVFSADLSGIVSATDPWWIRGCSFPPPDIGLISDWERKLDVIARQCLAADIRAISGQPSWLLALFARIRQYHGQAAGRLTDWFPHLELIVYGGMNFSPYRSNFAPLLAGGNVAMREVYGASEGFIALADGSSENSLRLCLDNGLFFEFVPTSELTSADPTRHWIATVEKEVDYALVVSSNAGLWSYVLGDVVRFVDTHEARIVVSGRTTQTLSDFGEHLTDREVSAAIASVADRLGLIVAEFAVGPCHPRSPDAPGHHIYIVEFAGRMPSDREQARFAELLDQTLQDNSYVYEDLRSAGIILSKPEIEAVARGTFVAWMKHKGTFGGQHKMPRILNNQDTLSDFREFAASNIARIPG
jgi:hypothetical protein